MPAPNASVSIGGLCVLCVFVCVAAWDGGCVVLCWYSLAPLAAQHTHGSNSHTHTHTTLNTHTCMHHTHLYTHTHSASIRNSSKDVASSRASFQQVRYGGRSQGKPQSQIPPTHIIIIMHTHIYTHTLPPPPLSKHTHTHTASTHRCSRKLPHQPRHHHDDDQLSPHRTT